MKAMRFIAHVIFCRDYNVYIKKAVSSFELPAPKNLDEALDGFIDFIFSRAINYHIPSLHWAFRHAT